MSRNLLESAKTYLSDKTQVRVAHLVQLELATGGTFVYLTDYMKNITWDTNTYESGKITKLSDVRQTQGLTNYKVTVDVAGEFQEELDRGLVENTNLSYVGKSVIIYRAYLDDAGAIVAFDKTTNGPMNYFTGEVTDIKITEGVTTSVSKVSWSCAGSFQDFEKISGRLTDDKSHRALEEVLGYEAPSASVKKPEYGLLPGQVVAGDSTDALLGDLGFMHAGQAIGLVSKYTTIEKRYKLKKSWGGLKSKLVSKDVEVEKELEIGIDLETKTLPVVYGVRKITGIPVFVDTVASDSNKIYIVYAFCEGEIDAFLNLYVDGESVIALNPQMDGTGNQMNGDTMSMLGDSGSEVELNERYEQMRGSREDFESGFLLSPTIALTPKNTTVGTSHGEVFDVPSDSGGKWIQVHHGVPNQSANPRLTSIAAANNFTIQKAGGAKFLGSKYWGANHRLLDTAYIVMQIAISEDESSIPTLDAIVSGKNVSTWTDPNTSVPNVYSLNPVWQLLEYATNTSYGAGIPIEAINKQSFIDVAAELDVPTSTYDVTYVPYWRYLGWKTEDNTHLQTMQCNTVLLTEKTISKNVKGLLEQFEGTINLLGDKYHLSLENNAPTIADITMDEVIGSITTKDVSGKNKWNSIEANIIDPALDWKGNKINFFHDDFLAQDNNIPKKGQVSFQHITNYYTARAWAERQLKKSRYSRHLTFTTYFKYLYLYPNANVTFTYGRFGYDKKVFRVTNVSLKTNGLVSLTLEDFDGSIYLDSDSPNIGGEVTPISNRPVRPQGLTYTELPDANFPIAEENLAGVHGILHWDQTGTTDVLRYEVRDWHEVTTDTTVPTTQTITDDTGKVWHYILVTDLILIQIYKFKVLSIDNLGRKSVYSVVTYDNTTNNPVRFTPITGLTSDARDGVFVGPDFAFSWDAHTDPAVTAYNVEVLDNIGTLLKAVSRNVGEETSTFTLTENKAAYATLNAGGVGAYREFKVRVRAYSGTITSDWVELI